MELPGPDRGDHAEGAGQLAGTLVDGQVLSDLVIEHERRRGGSNGRGPGYRPGGPGGHRRGGSGERYARQS